MSDEDLYDLAKVEGGESFPIALADCLLARESASGYTAIIAA